MRFILYALLCTSIFSQSVQSSFSSNKKRTVFIEYAGSISTVFSPIEINQNNNVLLISHIIAGNDDLPISPVLIGKIKISWNLSLTGRTTAFSSSKRAFHSYGWGLSFKPGQPEENSPWSFHYNSGNFRSYDMLSASSASSSIVRKISLNKLSLFIGYTANTTKGIDYTSSKSINSKTFNEKHSYFTLGTIITIKGIKLFPSFAYGTNHKILSIGFQNQF